MPNITNPEAINFCNSKIRVAADVLAQAYNTMKSIRNEWYAKNLGVIIPNTTDLVEDGSDIDGRHQITGADATGIIVRAEEFINDYEAGGNAKLNTIIKVAVNGQSRV